MKHTLNCKKGKKGHAVEKNVLRVRPPRGDAQSKKGHAGNRVKTDVRTPSCPPIYDCYAGRNVCDWPR
jgi:hypothetical protein